MIAMTYGGVPTKHKVLRQDVAGVAPGSASQHIFADRAVAIPRRGIMFSGVFLGQSFLDRMPEVPEQRAGLSNSPEASIGHVTNKR